MEGLIIELLPKIESIAPHIWAYAMRQVWVNVLLSVIIGIALLGFIIWAYVRVQALPGDDYDDKAMAWGGWLVLTAIFGATSIVLLYRAISGCLNPQWRAVEQIIGLLVSK